MKDSTSYPHKSERQRWTGFRAEVNEQVASTYAEKLFDSITEMGNGFGEAADGAGELHDGAAKLVRGCR